MDVLRESLVADRLEEGWSQQEVAAMYELTPAEVKAVAENSKIAAGHNVGPLTAAQRKGVKGASPPPPDVVD